MGRTYHVIEAGRAELGYYRLGEGVIPGLEESKYDVVRSEELTFFVPPAQGTTHCPEAPSAEQEDHGPATGSYPAEKAKG